MKGVNSRIISGVERTGPSDSDGGPARLAQAGCAWQTDRRGESAGIPANRRRRTRRPGGHRSAQRQGLLVAKSVCQLRSVSTSVLLPDWLAILPRGLLGQSCGA